ncbi:MAG: hypothetical protein RR280_10410, partial [Bacteroidaceae bacterium]
MGKAKKERGGVQKTRGASASSVNRSAPTARGNRWIASPSARNPENEETVILKQYQICISLQKVIPLQEQEVKSLVDPGLQGSFGLQTPEFLMKLSPRCAFF